MSRIKKLQANLQCPILIKKKENLFYLTGRSFDIHAEEYLLVTKTKTVALGWGLEKIEWFKNADNVKNIGKYLATEKVLAVEDIFSLREYDYFRIRNKELRIKTKAIRNAVEEARATKEPGEIALIKKSMEIVEAVFKLARKEIKKPKITEIKLAKFIESSGLRMGANDLSFPAIVASGANAAVPHHLPSNKKIKAGESIILDFGFKYKNYCSDFTRTIFLKKVHPKLEVAYNQVEKAYNESINYINTQKGVPLAADVYKKSVDVLAEKHLDKYFIHSLGHGTGLEIHELPNLSPNSKEVLADGMVFSIEPGVYLPKVGGIRIEDLVYLKQGSIKKFINVPTKLKGNIL